MLKLEWALATGAALALAACQSQPAQQARASAVAPLDFDVGAVSDAAPVASDDVNSVWDYLRERYDADGNGSITGDEYGRGDDRFGSLDANDDGAITKDDLDSGSGGRRGGMMAGMMFMRFFQIDDDPEVLTASELEESIDIADKDFDDQISAEEFEYLVDLRLDDAADDADDRMGSMMSGMMRRMNPFEMLAGQIDKDDDGAMSRDELLAHFQAIDEDEDGELTRQGPGGGHSGSRVGGMFGGRGRGDRSRDGGDHGDGESERSGGPAQGERAPDFTLQQLNGEGAITLSHFIADRPVALIFGSYT